MPVACCGPKLSVCGIVLSIWGVIMLALLGVFFRVHAVALLEDLPINQTYWAENAYKMDYIDGLYNQASTNCFIAAGIYVGVFAFSFIMWRVNKRADYSMS